MSDLRCRACRHETERCPTCHGIVTEMNGSILVRACAIAAAAMIAAVVLNYLSVATYERFAHAFWLPVALRMASLAALAVAAAAVFVATMKGDTHD